MVFDSLAKGIYTLLAKEKGGKSKAFLQVGVWKP
jgi:hypothetical protein